MRLTGGFLKFCNAQIVPNSWIYVRPNYEEGVVLLVRSIFACCCVELLFAAMGDLALFLLIWGTGGRNQV